MQNISIRTRTRGQVPVAEATDEELRNFIRWQKDQFDSGKVQERFAELNERQLAEAEREVQRRRDGKSSAPAAALAKSPEVQVLGKAIRDPAAVTKFLSDLAEHYNVIGPATSVDMLPEGFGVAVAYVKVDPTKCYSVGQGKLGVPGSDLKRIALAAGLTWDPGQSGRTDNGRDPLVVAWREIGHYRAFDGTVLTAQGSVEIDMRDSSAQVEAIRIAAKKRDGSNGDGEIREIRKFILRHAESKAKNRAVADMGIRRAYTQEELAKPFAVARLTWTGATEDPLLRREFARMFAEQFLGGTRVLYGSSAPPARQLAPPSPDPEFDRFDDFDTYGEGMEDVA